MAVRERGGSPEPGMLSIGALSRATGVPIPTLRTWERRYGSPRPVRKPSGQRVYPATMVDRLRRVGELLGLGHRAAEVLGLAPAELDALLALSRGPVPAAAPAPSPSSSAGETPVAAMLDAVARLDRDALLAQLRAAWAGLGPLRFLEDAAGALMTEIGERWRRGALGIRHEHFATACLAGFLREVREPFEHRARGPRVVTATLPGDAHEGGLLMAGTVLAARGWRVLHLGPGVPVEQIAAAARETGARAVALSISTSLPAGAAARQVASLRGALPARVVLWVGGRGAPPARRGVERFESLQALDDRLVSPAWRG